MGILQRLRGSAYKRALWLDHTVSARWNRASGVSGSPRSRQLIVSLTTIPERVGGIHVVLDSLLRQSLKPDRIILWLNECHESGRPVIDPIHLPDGLKRMEQRGLTIAWCPNIGPYCKLIPALREFPDALIATADDDVYYERDWLKMLYDAYEKNPQVIHCHRAHLMKYDESGELLPYRQWEYFAPGKQGPSSFLFPTGVGGILYAPGQLHPDVTREDLFQKLAPKADDVWLKAMAIANGTLCAKVAAESPHLYSYHYRNDRRLMRANVSSDGNDKQIRQVAEQYPAFAALVHRDTPGK